MSDGTRIRTVGLIVHPKRALEAALDAVGDWAAENGVEIRQVAGPGEVRRVADPAEPDECDLLVAVGGDGTALAALHAGAGASRPVLGIACGSIGALTAVGADRAAWALGEVSAGRFEARSLPALDLSGATCRRALNDVAVGRSGGGQVTVAIHVDGELYAQLAGDGVIVSTPLGSSAYTMAAGGPLLTGGCEVFAVTPLAPHGGSIPPLVVSASGHLRVEVDGGHGGMRLEVDGQMVDPDGDVLEVGRHPDYATLVRLPGDESLLAGLRRRGLVLDSPRATLRAERS